jgi:drug/metabolite transporter (DMT)-like permease
MNTSLGTRPPQAVLGMLSALAAALTWGATLALTRAGVVGPAGLQPADMALLRFLVPAVLLAPSLRGLAWPRARLLVVLLAGGGVPFMLLVAAALRHAGTAEAGALLPGAFPLFVALLSVLSGRERLQLVRALGLAVILGSVLLVAGPGVWRGGDGAWRGHAMLLAAALLSAGYTLALRQAGLGPWQAAGVVSVGSMAWYLPAYALWRAPLPAEVAWPAVAGQALLQGGLAGVAGPVLFAFAVRQLGPARAAAFGGLTPAAAALFGAVLLHEVPHASTLVALLGAGVGVAMASTAAQAGERGGLRRWRCCPKLSVKPATTA